MKISKNKIMIIAIIVLCVASCCNIWLQYLLSEKIRTRDNDDKFTPTIDSDAGEIGTGSNNSSGGQQGQAIRIPGYPSITVAAG